MSKKTKKSSNVKIPDDPWMAFGYFITSCTNGFARELIAQGKTPRQARYIVIGCFLDMAAGEACRIAREEGLEPDKSKWRKATNKVFDRAVKRTSKKKAMERE